MPVALSEVDGTLPWSLEAHLCLKLLCLGIKQAPSMFFANPSPNASFLEILGQLHRIGNLGCQLLKHFPATFINTEYHFFENLLGHRLRDDSSPDSFRHLMLNLQNPRKKAILNFWVWSWDDLLCERTLRE